MKPKGVKMEAGLMKKSHCQWKIDWWFYRYRFIRTFLSESFCPLPFCPRNLQRHVAYVWHPES